MMSHDGYSPGGAG
ncbi:unnamed protein product, partial [Rotaria sp. Silwood2]